MGDAVVSALVKEVVRRLTSLAIQEFVLLWELKDDILRLKDDFEKIQAVLQDAEDKHNKEKAVELWLKSLRSASLMVDDVLDEVSTEALLQCLHKDRGIRYRVKAFLSSDHNKFMTHVMMAHKVKDLRTKLDSIASKRFELKLTPSTAISHEDDMGVVGEMPDRETSSLIHDSSVIYGRNEEMEMVTGKICNKDIGKYDNGEIRVYGIWGMGGLGKTTLAQLVYNHERVNQYFDLKCWVYVSENFQVKEIIKGIIDSIDECGCTLTQLHALQVYLQNKLRGKKFCIILDDVWIEHSEKSKWEQLSKILSCGAEESIVVVTTRSLTTCQMMAKVPELQHRLGCLSEEDSWLLFKKFAFAQGREGDDISELEPIGREIVEKCKGLPLAVKTLGSLMWSERCASDWQRVKCSIIWELQENNVLPALKLSYDKLLPHLKRCLAYCCLYPKGYSLEEDELILLWLSNGFIPPRGEIDLYVLGKEIFKFFISRSFFQAHNKYSYVEYKMHDLMHDMARYMMRHDCLIMESGKELKIQDKVLHMSLACPNEEFHFSSEDTGNLTSLRSLFLFRHRERVDLEEYVYSIILNQVPLRVLYLVRIKLQTLPESICKLKHLRYLNLSYSSITVLPESIMYLQNLQMLILSYCINLHMLPKGLTYIRNLQRLDIDGCLDLSHLPCGIKKLTSLRRLSIFPVGDKSGAKIRELRDLNLLEGELLIERLENVGGLSEAKSTNLKCKRNLKVLKLQWSNPMPSSKLESRRISHDKGVLEGLEPNPILEVLEMHHYLGKTLSPSWFVKLRNLVRICVNDCRKCERIPPLGRLPNLREVTLINMASLKCFHDDDTSVLGDTTDMFPSLRSLHIRGCPSLVSLPSSILKLKDLIITDCDTLRDLPDEILKDLNKLEIHQCKHLSNRCEKKRGVNWPKICHISSITIS